MIPSAPLIRTRSLGYRYGGAEEDALRDVSIDIFPGEYVAVLGANGSGKSTLLKLLVALLPPAPGAVAVRLSDGKSADPATPDGARAARRAVSVVLQNPDDQIVGTVAEEDVAFGPGNLGLSRTEIDERVAEALRAVGLTERRLAPPHLLSGGERQRLAIAGALAMRSSVLALDEAASMVDPRGRAALLDTLDRISAGPSRPAVLHVTHSMEDAARAARVLVLSAGSLVFDGTPAELFARPELEAWSLVLPEALACARSLRSVLPFFAPRRLDPEGFAAELAAELRERPSAAGSAADASSAASSSASAVASGTGTAAAPAALEFSGVSHRYLAGTAFAATALEGIDLSVRSGTATALVGATGAGKSTLLKHGNAVLLPTAGRVVVLGQDTLDASVPLRPLRLRSVLSPQNPEAALFSRYVADDVAYGPRNKGLSGRALVAAVRGAMEKAGLPYGRFRDRETGLLSGGERRKAALAGAFALDAELYLLDEPSAALDPASARAALDAILSLRDAGATVVATTHSMEEASRFDRLVVMAGGRIAAEGHPRDLFYGRYDPAWGIALPWAAAAARALAALGAPVRGAPLTAAELASCVAGTPGPAAAPGLERPYAASLPAPRPRRKRRGVGVEFFRNATLGQYLDRPSPLQDLGPGDKLFMVFALGLPTLLGDRPEVPAAALAAALGLGLAARIGPRHLLRSLLPALPYLLFIALFQVLFAWPGDESRAFLRWGWFDVTAAELGRTYFFAVRMASLMALLSLFSGVTSLSEALAGISALLRPAGRLGLPVRDVSAVVGIAFRFVPVLAEEAERIAVAQLSRGGGYEGKGRVRAGAALTVPLFLRALERAQTLATAMELRLHGGVREPGAAAFRRNEARPAGRSSRALALRAALIVISVLLCGRALYFF
jgi:energy-coupling factor transport system ATP-binding protein